MEELFLHAHSLCCYNNWRGIDFSQRRWWCRGLYFLKLLSLFVQHTNGDLPFQNQCLTLLTAAVEAGDASARHMAYLEDRVRVNEGRPQLYSTQYRIHNGDFFTGEIEDRAGVEVRRAKVGLGSFEEQVTELRHLYKPQEE